MNDGTALQTTLVQWHHKFLKSSLGCFILLFFYFFPFEILSNVVVVTLATAAIALLCLLTSAGKKK